MFLLRWLWSNLSGYRGRYITALLLSVICQTMYLITPMMSQRIVDTFIVSENSAEMIRTQPNLLIMMVAAMVGFTFLRTCMTYSANMLYESTSQAVVYKVRKKLYENINMQDATFYHTHQIGRAHV